MKKTTYVKAISIVFLFLVCSQLFAQNFVPFTPRFNQDLKGDIVLIGNNILGPDNNAFNNGSVFNHTINMQYIDIDSDPSTFSSSSADLAIQNTNCYRIIHAGLYWGAVTNGSDAITNIKFKGPTGSYNDVVGTVVFDANGTSVDDGDSFPYVCYADVTSIVTDLANDLGTYTVANVSSAEGQTNTYSPPNDTGHSAGWSLFIVYEDPTLPGKSITSFDGFSAISVSGGNPILDIPVSGFRTVPAPTPVRANFAFATLEGDSPILGDQLLLNGVNLSTADRPATNFFNSSVTQLNATPVNNRNPNSSNTLGFDTGVMVVPNPSNSVIANDDTSATVGLETSGDTYFPYFFALAVDIIEPNIVLTKIVEDALGANIGGQLVNLGDELNYVIGFQNTGNDDATNVTIRDVLPTNIVFNYPTDIVSLPSGVTVQSYDPVTREIIFAVDNSVVEVNDPVQEIRFRVTVVQTCSLLNDVCDNIINNQAFLTYNGTLNPTFTISDDPSFNVNTGCLLIPGITNFLADIDCDFTEEAILCGASTTLTAGDGYNAYSWSTSPSGTPVIGTTQSITVTSVGTYYVHNEAIAPCQSINQIFNVITYGAGVTNPLIPFADEVVICPNDGKELPNFYLCGANDSRFIQTNITNTNSMIWEKLDESSCTAVTNQDCANEDVSCTWNQVETGPDYLIDTAGQYRLTLNYDGGCFNQFYFNVYTNLLVPTVTSRDIICTTLGEITVGGVPSGYEYSIDGTNYQTSNVFTINTPNIYSVYVRQIGVTPNPCIFSVPDVQIRQRDFTVSTNITEPYCNGDLGSVNIAANDVRPQYYFSIYDGATLINSVGPIASNNYTFDNLNPGTYTVNVSTDDGCMYSRDIDIIDPPLLKATAALTQPLTCTDGEITVYPVGGTAPYFYFVNSTTVFQTTPVINVTTAGVYNITVVDSNNCSADVSITVDASPEPDFNINETDILCSDAGDVGTININVTNPNGNSLEYSIDNGVTFFNSPVFTGLAASDYDVVVQYTLGTDVCTTKPQTINISAITAINGVATLTTPYTCTTNGVITVSSVTGGTAPYTYSLDGVTFQGGLTFSGLTDGTYTVTIRDVNECTFLAAPIVIDPLNPPTDLAFSNSPLSCPSLISDVTIASTTGGTTPLEYRIISPSITAYQTSNIFSGLSPDTYTFEVRDANNCTYSESYIIAPLPPLTVSTIITKNLDCTASPDGIITGNIIGGTAPFTYQASFNGGTYGSSIVVTGATFAHAAAADGTYQFRITDANGCTADSGVQTINAIIPVTASNTTNNPTCNGGLDGSVTLHTLTGAAPFTFSIDGGATYANTNTFGGLNAGVYNYSILDSKGCEDNGTITLTDPAPIDVTITSTPIVCNVNTLGSFSVSINSGGVANYMYTLYDRSYNLLATSGSTSATTYNFPGLTFGDYYITVIDANGCEFISSVERIDTPPILTLNGFVDSNNCATGVDYTVITSGGTPDYIFSIFGQPATASPPQTSPAYTFTGLLHNTTYFLEVEDVNNCISILEVITPLAPSSINISGTTSTHVTCNGASDGTLNFTAQNYDATVTDIEYQVLDALSLLPVAPAINGTLTGSAGGPVSGRITTLSAGNYVLQVTESTGTVCAANYTFQITQPIQALSSTIISQTNANCNANAQVSLNTTGGTGPYMYAAGATGFTPVMTDFVTSNVLNLDPAVRTNWDIVVRDANGCETLIPVIITSDPEPVISAVVNNQCTVAEGNFEIDVTLTTAGIPPYSYSIDGGAFQTRTAPFSVSNLSSGNHTVEIQDANGCVNLVNVTIEPPLAISPSVSTLPTCNDDDGEITITGSGGTGVYTYAVSPNPSSVSLSGNVYSGIPSGTYVITITDATTLCTEDVTITVPAVAPPTVTTNPTAITCFGNNNGSFELNVSGYTGAYNYEVFNSASVSVFGVVAANTSTNPQLVSGLLGETYTVVITETSSPFCSATSSVIIASPIDALTVVATETSNVTCDDDKGTITAIASGGWGTYEYELTGAATVAYSSNGTFTNLSAGTYTVNVRDAGGCIESDTVILNIPPPINANVTASTNLLSCFGDTNASINVSAVSGGAGSNYAYTLHRVTPTVSASGPQTSPVFSDLGAGTYRVVVTDGYNCSFNSPDVTISEPTPIQASLVKETSQTCFTNTRLTLSATGGTGAYEYSDSVTFSTVLGSFAASTSFSVSTGIYQYYIRDANACVSSVSNAITIDPLPPLLVNLDGTNATINCAGDNTGVIVATAQGGLGNYVYTLQDALGNNITPVTQNSPGVFTNLPVGNYQVQVDSGDCLTTSAQISITEPAAPLTANLILTNVTCPGINNGQLEINASGGTGVIKYAISPRLDQFFETSIFEDLAPGNYQTIAQDELGCFVIYDFTIIETPPVVLTIVANSVFPEVCSGDLDGEFSVDLSGGNLPYSVSLNDINGTYTTGSATQTQFDFIGLAGGNHMVYVRDALGCESDWNITFPESVLINPTVNIDYGCVNNVSGNTVTVSVDSSITNLADLDYALNGGLYQTSNVFIDIPAGLNHYIDVRHTNGCIKRTLNFDIPQFDPLQLVLEDGALNEIVAVASGGSGDYTYALNGEDYGSTNTFIIYESGDYTVVVTDSNGCTVTATRYFEYVDVCIPNYFTPNGDGNLDEWGPGCTEQYRDLTFDIFDRYGRKIATLKIGQKWNGKYNGKELPTGDYWYVVKLNNQKDDREFVGHFTLYR